MVHQDRYIEAKTNGGWGIASLVVTVAIVLIAAVTYFHKATYKSPNDVTYRVHGEQAQ